MIAKCAGTGKSFVGLARYLVEGRKGQHLERVLWTEGQNIASNDPVTAAVYMDSVANENNRVDRPVYHFSINWHPDESAGITQEKAIEIGKQALADLGLSNYQSLMVAHDDTDHLHLHVMVNRIHPDTHLSWKQGLSKVALEKSMARLSLEHGFEIVPGHHNAEDLGIEPPAPDVSVTTEELRFKERTGDNVRY